MWTSQLLAIPYLLFTSHLHHVSSADSGFIPNYEYTPKRIPANYSEITVQVQGGTRSETELLKIDLANAICGDNVNIREITIFQLQVAFETGRLTSEQLVKCYLSRIELMNPFLNAVLETNPDAISIAQKLDKDRANGIYHGPLHGIPVMLKDSIGTADTMQTTAGSVALLGLKPKEDAEVVKRLRKAGAVILGKANLSEFGNFRATDMPNGWSGRGGRTNNAYIRSGDSCGSSSGSAVSVAANLVTVALGGETDGSIICPSREQSLVGLKPGVGRVSVEGSIGISFTQDVIGPMTRTVSDAAFVFSVIQSPIYDFRASDKNCHSVNEANVTESSCEQEKAIRIGILRSPHWEIPQLAEQIPTLEKIVTKLGEVTGFTIIDPVEAAPGTNASVTNTSVVRPPNNTIHNLSDIIKFNKEFPPKEGYNQINLENSDASDGILNSTYIANRDKNKRAAQNYVDFILTKYDLDAIVIPSNNSTRMPAVAGYPHITVPAGFRQNGIPYGISFYSGVGSEEKLLYIAYQVESVHKARRTSTFLD